MAQHNRRSLVDDSVESVGASKKSKAKSGGSGNGVKVALIVVCLVAAAALLAYNFGIIGNPFAEKVKPAVRTEEDQQVIQEFQKANEATQKAPNPPVVGGS